MNKGNQVGVYNALSMSPLASPYDDNGNLKRTVHMPNDESILAFQKWEAKPDKVEY